MIHSLTIVPATGCLCKISVCDGMPSPLPLCVKLDCASSKKRQAWRKLRVKAAHQSYTVVPRESGESSTPSASQKSAFSTSVITGSSAFADDDMESAEAPR